jgi:hypothetical protein
MLTDASMRRATAEERRAMNVALDRFVEDERCLREQNRSPHHGCLYDPRIEQLMEAPSPEIRSIQK